MGFFIGDELFPGKISFDNFTSALRAVQDVKNIHKDKNLVSWENEGGTGWIDFIKEAPGGKLPVELDIISIDDYSLNVRLHGFRTCCDMPMDNAIGFSSSGGYMQLLYVTRRVIFRGLTTL